jgi:adenylate cyclase
MTQKGFKRKLTAILSADVVGYSRLMGEDEESTVRTLTTYREVIRTLIIDHKGRVVDSPGDNILAEFVSIVDALRCAWDVQQEIKSRNADLSERRRMNFRLGVNLGDVIEEGDRIYGDGVNITARLESIAEEGGICISGTAYDQVKNKLPFRYEYQGQQTVKNIKEPVRVYRIVMKQETGREVIDGKNRILNHWRKTIIVLGVIIFLLAGAAVYVWNTYFRLPSVERMPEGKRIFNLSKGPSVAVLPFVNMSADPEQDYFSDGLTENIITGLSGCPKLFVIARNSTFTYKGKPVKIQKVARELGVEYVIEGSVQKTDDHVRINVQLIDAASGHHVWAEKYDRKLKDIFALQDEITLKLVSALEVQLTEGEQARLRSKGPVSLKAYMKGLKGLEYIRRFNKEDIVRARQNAEQAIALAPDFAGFYVLMAVTHLQDIRFGSTSSPLISFAKATENINKAFALDKKNSDAHLVLGILYLVKGQHEKAIAAEEKAVALNPNGADAYCQLGYTLIMSGKPEDGIRFIRKAMRLNPNPPGYYFEVLGYAYFGTKQYNEAVNALKKSIEREPTIIAAHLVLAAYYASAGMEKEARDEVAEVYKIDPHYSLKDIQIPYKDPEVVKEAFENLRKAGFK